jgi:hypothetical protein
VRTEQGDTETKIRGVVVPMAWDERGNVVAIALSTHDEHEYAIDKEGKGEELLSLIRKEIVVNGIVTEKEKKKIIRIVNYSVKRGRIPEESSAREKPGAPNPGKRKK